MTDKSTNIMALNDGCFRQETFMNIRAFVGELLHEGLSLVKKFDFPLTKIIK
jgi:hypothetical protein